MYLLSYQQIADMIAGLAASGSCCSSPEGAVYPTLQSAIRTRVEEALNIEQLTRGVWVDRFRIPTTLGNRLVTLRLTNGFIDNPDGVVIELSSGEEAPAPVHVDSRLGMVELIAPAGLLTVKYTSGFPIENQDSKRFAHTPEWMQTIALAAAKAWTLATSSGGQPKEISLGALTAAIKHELSTRIYERYDRPRAGAIWTLSSGRRLDEQPAAFNEAEAKSW